MKKLPRGIGRLFRKRRTLGRWLNFVAEVNDAPLSTDEKRALVKRYRDGVFVGREVHYDIYGGITVRVYDAPHLSGPAPRRRSLSGYEPTGRTGRRRAPKVTA